jgi:biopolymer transport protein ExbB
MDGFSFELISSGGVIMWPIFICSIAALTIAIERFYSLRRFSADSHEFLDVVRTAARQRRFQDAAQVCDETGSPLARIIKAGLLKQNRPLHEIRQAMEDAGRLEVPRLERYLPGLATCASIAPLLGLLGTVQGMIKCFSVIGQNQGQINPADLAEGIGNALTTTFAGLVVAIPTLVVYNYFVSRVDSTIAQMEIAATEFADTLVRDREEGIVEDAV